MFIVDEPYISDFLIHTIRDHNFRIISTPAARKLADDNGLAWIEEEEAVSRIKSSPSLPLYSASENGLNWITQHLEGSELARQINVFKDKFQFRNHLREHFPSYYYRQFSLEDLRTLDVRELTFPFVIKPSVGFFSLGVHVVNHEADWYRVRRELQPEKLRSRFPASVLNTSHFLLEAFITGDEYAIDYYHDSEGKVVVLNILHHVFSSGSDTSDRVYTTSKKIITSLQDQVKEFLTVTGEKLNLKNFPAHAEIRIDQNGNIRPIEINPLRFGGWCTTGDLLGVSLGFNSYDCFFSNRVPDWDSIFKDKEDQLISIIVLNNNSGIDPVRIAGFDYQKLGNDLENAIVIRKTDFRQYPLFGFVFAETSPSNQKELDKILRSDLREYIIRT